MRKILLLFSFISTFAIGQVVRDLPYQDYYDKDLSKMKMELIFKELISEKKLSVISADKNSYFFQFTGNIKVKMLVSFNEQNMTFTFSNFFIKQEGKTAPFPKEYESEISDDYFNIFKSAYYNNL